MKEPSRSRRRFLLRHDGDDVDVEQPFVIGRENDCQLVLKRDLVSRKHARFVETAEGLVIEDLRSMNGVFVNERRIAGPTLLAHGDVVSIGLESLEVIDRERMPRPAKPTRPQPLSFQQSDVEGPEPVTVAPQLDRLSEREREVFGLIVVGHTQREIADLLHLSVKTIETHRAHIAEKLGCRTRAELVAYAINAGLLRKGRP